MLFTKRAAYDEYSAGHLRNVSLEIGQYETNDEVLYDDVVQGLAFVDIPAVEGLHQRPTGEESMGTENKGEAQETAESPEPTVPPPTPTPTPTPEPTPTPTQATPQPEPVGAHRRPEVHTFRVNGAEITDAAAVQTHIDALEKFRSDTNTSLRNSFVDDLVKQGVILAPKAEAMKTHVASLGTEQFAAFREMYEDAPVHNLFGKHDTTTSPEVIQHQDALDERALAEEIIKQFRRQGRTEEFIQKQPQWAVLNAPASK